MTVGPAGEQWRAELAGWAIPAGILAAAPESPWGFPVEMFRAPTDPAGPADTPSRRRALAALPPGGSVLDVGCGGGAAALALVPPAGSVTGVDSAPAMLPEFATAAAAAGVAHREVAGDWPTVAAAVHPADVAVAHHVGYNAPDLAGFATALTATARRRVVLEMTAVHPMVALGPLWRRFHDLPRPAGPTAELAVAVLTEAGVPASVERFSRPPRRLPRHVLVAFTRRRLCLPPQRDPEVDAALGPDYTFQPRELVTLWWDP